jgi:glycosyltransferase involved in cell wall biosynthesis
MSNLLSIIIAWNRPEFLKRTLESLFLQMQDIQAQIVVVDNGSDSMTRQVIEQDERIGRRIFLGSNLGINRALEVALPVDVSQEFQHILISDADMDYRRPFGSILQAFDGHPEIGAVSLQHSPEHWPVGEITFNDELWPLKRVERGCSLLFRAARFQELRPLPVHKMLDFDWWVMRDAPQSLQSRNQFVAVCPGAAIHLGWRAGDSTWQSQEIPEFDAFRS